MRIKEEKTTRETPGVRSVENVWWRELGGGGIEENGWHALRASDTYIFKSTDCFQGLNAHQNWGEALQKHLHTSALFFILQPQQRLWTNVLHRISGALWKINVTNDDFFFKFTCKRATDSYSSEVWVGKKSVIYINVCNLALKNKWLW